MPRQKRLCRGIFSMGKVTYFVSLKERKYDSFYEIAEGFLQSLYRSGTIGETNVRVLRTCKTIEEDYYGTGI